MEMFPSLQQNKHLFGKKDSSHCPVCSYKQPDPGTTPHLDAWQVQNRVPSEHSPSALPTPGAPLGCYTVNTWSEGLRCSIPPAFYSFKLPLELSDCLSPRGNLILTYQKCYVLVGWHINYILSIDLCGPGVTGLSCYCQRAINIQFSTKSKKCEC